MTFHFAEITVFLTIGVEKSKSHLFKKYSPFCSPLRERLRKNLLQYIAFYLRSAELIKLYGVNFSAANIKSIKLHRAVFRNYVHIIIVIACRQSCCFARYHVVSVHVGRKLPTAFCYFYERSE